MLDQFFKSARIISFPESSDERLRKGSSSAASGHPMWAALNAIANVGLLELLEKGKNKQGVLIRVESKDKTWKCDYRVQLTHLEEPGEMPGAEQLNPDEKQMNGILLPASAPIDATDEQIKKRRQSYDHENSKGKKKYLCQLPPFPEYVVPATSAENAVYVYEEKVFEHVRDALKTFKDMEPTLTVRVTDVEKGEPIDVHCTNPVFRIGQG